MFLRDVGQEARPSGNRRLVQRLRRLLWQQRCAHCAPNCSVPKSEGAMIDGFNLAAPAGPWSEAVPCFSRAGYSCPAFKNPTDYFMRVVASDPNAVSTLVTQHTCASLALSLEYYRTTVKVPRYIMFP